MFEQNTNKNPSNEPSLTQDELNIFKEFSWNLDFWNETVELNKWVEQKKDKEYYLKIWATVFSVFNIIFFTILIFFTIFLNIQNSKDAYSQSYLDPFCFIILWEEFKNTWDSCSSVASLIPDYESKNKDLIDKIVKKISPILSDVYDINNFMDSKEVTFLISQKDNKLKVLDMLNSFDNMKNDFTKNDSKSIVCDNIDIKSDNTLSINCTAYSSSWDTGIIWGNWNNLKSIQWTSISLASSFLNFIDNNPMYNFKLLEWQSDFTAESVVWYWAYVKKTSFSFKLKYNNLSL